MWIEDRFLLGVVNSLIEFAGASDAAGKGLTFFGGVRQALLEFAGTSSEGASLAHAVEEVARLLDSPVALYHELDCEGRLVTLRHWHPRLKGESVSVPVTQAGIWRSVILDGAPKSVERAVRVEELSALPQAMPAPECLLIVPVQRGGQVVATLSVGGRARPYDTADTELVLLIADVIWEIVSQKRSNRTAARLLQAIEQTSEMVVVTDAQALIEYVNPAFERVTGYKRSEVIGRNPSILKSGQHDREFYRGLWRTLKSGQTFVGRMVNQRKDGTVFVEDATISPVMDLSGSVVNFVAVKRDISEQLVLEARLRQTSKMESVGRLAGGVAHDFNNVLNVILGHSDLALESLGPGERFYDEFQEIRKAALRSASLTRQLLGFARKQTAAREVMDLNETLQDLLSMLKRLMGEEIELRWEPYRGLWMTHLDPSQFSQILVNLCVNSRDAITGHGEVSISTSNVELDEHYCLGHPGARPGEYVLVTLRDNGHGMTEEVMAQIFEPFFTTKPEGVGTGLGLATVYGIVKQNNGFVDVESEVGRGTTFRVFLGRYTGAVTRRPKPTSGTLPRGNGETVLVVEDDESILKLTDRLLKKLGYETLLARSPSSALELPAVELEKASLLLTDVIMPVMNGKELAGRLRGDCPTLKVLFMSGYTADVIAHQGLLSAGTHFIGKPFSILELGYAVHKVLTGPGEEGDG